MSLVPHTGFLPHILGISCAMTGGGVGFVFHCESLWPYWFFANEATHWGEAAYVDSGRGIVTRETNHMIKRLKLLACPLQLLQSSRKAEWLDIELIPRPNNLITHVHVMKPYIKTFKHEAQWASQMLKTSMSWEDGEPGENMKLCSNLSHSTLLPYISLYLVVHLHLHN